ncbi:MAG: hypothetical protein KC912_26700 [Proteobacteria bacterium]|nr:hypothetical protein [Pseudomonadota bacterium]
MPRPLLILLVALTACEDPLESQCALAETVDARVLVGTGEDAFTAIDGPLDRQFGAQGGSHVWIALQTEGLAPGKGNAVAPPALEGGLHQGDVELGWMSAIWKPMRGTSESAEVAGLELRLDDTAWWDDTYAAEVGFDRDGPLTVSVNLVDACQNEAFAEIDVELNQ